MESLVGAIPNQILLHGSSKLLIDEYHWHLPKIGIITSYTPKAKDTIDHFGIFRGVDQIEAFAQATTVSCATFLEAKKRNCDPITLRDHFVPAFISVGQVYFHHPLAENDSFISVGHIKFYKFRQMVCDGRIYKVPNGFNLNAYFKDFTEEMLLNYGLPKDFILVAELFDITGRALKKEIFNQ